MVSAGPGLVPRITDKAQKKKKKERKKKKHIA